MINLTSVEDVQVLQKHLSTVFDSGPGKEVIKFLEEQCGWYDFQHIDPNMIMIQHGKRQVLATIKTLLKLTADQVVLISEEKEY